MFSKGSKSSSAKSRAGSVTSSGAAAAKAAPSIISADLKITGNLASAGDLQIDGAVEGDITSRQVTVGQSAHVQGAILADIVRIYGTVSGEIKADEVILAKGARVDGDICHQSIAMEAGASVSGRLTRLEKPAAAAETQPGGKPVGSGSTPSGTASSGAAGPSSSSSPNYSGYSA